MKKADWSGAKDGDSLKRAIEQPVALVDHDPRWAAAFDAERERLMRLFPGTFVEIAYIGSSGVEGMRTKPIVDLLAGVRSMDAAVALNGPLCANGYTTSPDFNRSLTDRQFFMRHVDGRRTHHLHVVVHDSPSWHERIDFCRMLHDDADLRRRYGALKDGLAERFANDRDSYTEGKTDFINAALNDSRTKRETP